MNHTHEKSAYPLSWPAGWPRTESHMHETARFQQTVSGALSNLKKEVNLMGGKNLILSSNYTLGVEKPKDSGVCAYFEYQTMAVAIPCDRWKGIEDNVQAIALTIKAMRGMERWGAKHMIKAMFTGFKALPAPSTSAWHEVLGVQKDASPELVLSAYRILSKKHHPDMGGDAELFRRLNIAKEEFDRLQRQL